MNDDHIFSKSEIGKILSKASEIQKQRDLYDDKDGLSKSELIELARETGIDQLSLLEAMQTFDEPGLDNQYNWLNGTSKIQHVINIDGEITNELWDSVIKEIRKETGGIGKTAKIGSSFEWEQRKKDIGYKHISLTPVNGRTNIQIVNSWTGIKFISTFFSIMIGFMLTAVALDGSSIADFALIIAPLGAIIGLVPSRIFLKSYYKRQKKQVEGIITRISRKLKSSPSITIENEDVYSNETTANKSKDRTA
tara:strand:- start:39636 stop:40388 length:753 start_codon:yes stop_codon:yes gene_type:complete